MKTSFLFVFFFLFTHIVFSQTFEIYRGDTINITDAQNFKQGKWIIFEKNTTRPKEEGSYADGKKQGLWKSYYPGGSLLSEIVYVDGEKNGPAKIYYENGKIAEEGVWKENKWVGEYRSYFQTGQIASHWNYNEDGKRNGEQKYFYKNGQIKIKGKWINGNKDGLISEYFENGALKSQKEYTEGAILTNSIVFYEKTSDSQPEKETNSDLTNNTDTKPDAEIFQGNGYHTFYNKKKQKEKEGHFVNGYLHDGKHFIYDDSGKLVKTIIYKDGKISERELH